jgi:hypothetical protein
MTVLAVLVALALFLAVMAAARNAIGTVLCDLMRLLGVPFNWYTDVAVIGVSTIAAPVVAFFLLAVGTASIVPPPQEFTYASMEKNADATFWERNVAYVMIGTGLADVKVQPGTIYSTAKMKTRNEEVTFVGLPGTGKWYRL